MTTIKRGRLSGYGYLPPNGTTGQHLAKASDNDGDAEWVDTPTSGSSFGVIGDGTTDNTEAFQNALNDAADTKRMLTIPPGRYLIGGNISCVNTTDRKFDGIVVSGCGTGLNNYGTVLEFSGASGSRWTFGAQDSASAFIDQFSLRDIGLVLTASSPSGTLLRITRAFSFDLKNVYLRGNNGTEALVDGDQWVIAKFERCYLRDAESGIITTAISGYSQAFANVIKFDSCVFDDLTVATDFRHAGRSIEFDTCTWEPAESGAASENHTGPYNAYFRNCWMGDANNHGTWITATGESVCVENCEIIAGGTSIDIQTSFPSRVEFGRYSGAVEAIKIAANRCTVRGARILCASDNSIGVNVVSGYGHHITENSVVESGIRAGTIAYKLATGSRGILKDHIGSTCDTFVSDGTTGNWEIDIISDRMTGATTTNVSTISAGAIATLTITIPGAEVGQTVEIGAPSGIEDGLIWSGYVSAADTVTVRIHNTTGSPIDPASGTWYARTRPTNL